MEPHHEVVRGFLAALSSGDPLDPFVAPDFTVWTAGSGTSPGARFVQGVALLRSIFATPLIYEIDSLTAEADRVAAEVHAAGTLTNGESYANRYVFLFRLREDRIASMAEHTDTRQVRDVLGPLLAKVIGRASGAA